MWAVAVSLLGVPLPVTCAVVVSLLGCLFTSSWPGAAKIRTSVRRRVTSSLLRAAMLYPWMSRVIQSMNVCLNGRGTAWSSDG